MIARASSGSRFCPSSVEIYDVDEQRRNHFAFALWNGLSLDSSGEGEAEDRRLGRLDRVGSRRGWRLLAKRGTTFIAEFRSGSIACPASGTMHQQGCATGTAEFGDPRILRIAVWTPHHLWARPQRQLRWLLGVS